jgi:hypothetical protein
MIPSFLYRLLVEFGSLCAHESVDVITIVTPVTKSWAYIFQTVYYVNVTLPTLGHYTFIPLPFEKIVRHKMCKSDVYLLHK